MDRGPGGRGNAGRNVERAGQRRRRGLRGRPSVEHRGRPARLQPDRPESRGLRRSLPALHRRLVRVDELHAVSEQDRRRLGNAHPAGHHDHVWPRGWSRGVGIRNVRARRLGRRRSPSEITFECKVDAQEWAPCETSFWSDATDDGWHTVSVRAFDDMLNVDPTPAERRWRTRHDEPVQAQGRCGVEGRSASRRPTPAPRAGTSTSAARSTRSGCTTADHGFAFGRAGIASASARSTLPGTRAT